MLLQYDNFVGMCSLLRSDGEPLNRNTVQKYYDCVNNHFGKIFKCDTWDKIATILADTKETLRLIDEYQVKLSAKFNILCVLNQISKHKDYSIRCREIGEMKRGEALSKKEIMVFDWAAKLLELEEKSASSRNDYQNYLIANIWYYHPRRVGDYCALNLVRDEVGELDPTKNYYLHQHHRFIFKTFKNSGAVTAGQMIVDSHPKLVPILDTWFSIYNDSSHVFLSKRGRVLSEDNMKKIVSFIGLPCSGLNRKQQESAELKSGKDCLAVAYKFNHSVTSQQINYNKILVSADQECSVSNIELDEMVSVSSTESDTLFDRAYVNMDILSVDNGNESLNQTGCLVREHTSVDIFRPKVKIRLRLVEYTFTEFSKGLSLSDSSKRQIYDYITSLCNEVSGITGLLTRVKIYQVFSGPDRIIEWINQKNASISSLRLYYYRLMVFANRFGVNVEKYSRLFEKYDSDSKSRTCRETISDQDWIEFNKTMTDQLATLSINLTINSDENTILSYRRVILMVLMLTIPVRKLSVDYRSLRNTDDGINNFYGNGVITYRHSDGIVQTKVNIPPEYRYIFEKYHAVSRQLSDHFIFTNGRKMYSMQNFSNMSKELFGRDIRSFASKWVEIIRTGGYSLSDRKMLLGYMGR